MDAMPEVPQLSFRGCAIPERPAVIELSRRPKELRDRLLLPFGFRERAAGKGSRESRVDPCTDACCGCCRGQRQLGGSTGSVSSATAAAARSANAKAKRSSEAAAASRASWAARSASSTRPSASQQRVSSSSQLALQPRGINRQLVAAARPYENIDGTPWIAGLDQHRGERHPDGGRHKATVEPAGESGTFLCGAERQLDITRRQRDERSVQQASGEGLSVPGNPGAFDRRVEELRPLDQLAARVSGPAEAIDERGHEFALSSRPSDDERSLCVDDGIGQAAEIELAAARSTAAPSRSPQLEVG